MKTLAILVLLSGVAHADEEDARGETKALLLSAGATAGAYAVIGAGVLTHSRDTLEAGAMASGIAPSLGEWYAGEYWTTGMTIRVGGGLLATVGLLERMSCDCEGRGNGPLIAGAALYAAGTLYDIATAPRAARRYNRDRARISLAPVPISRGAGLSLSGRF